MALNQTPYPNISRVISGAAILSPNDGILLCDTSSAPVTMTLLEIPAGFWQTTWKLFVLDNSNNAGTHNIVISVPSGYTINNLSTLTINTNGGGVTITIASNTAFFGQVSPLPSGGGGGGVTSITASSPLTGGTITTSGSIGITAGNLSETTSSVLTITGGTSAVIGSGATIEVSQASTSQSGYINNIDWTRFDDKTLIQTGLDPATNIPQAGRISFNSASFKIVSPAVKVASINMFDSGWVDLNGFAWMDAAVRPQCRRYGNLIYFRRSAVVPMGEPSNPANLYPYSATTDFYQKVENSTTYVGADTGGCLLYASGEVRFNKGISVLPSSVYDPFIVDIIDGSYYTGWKPQYRRFYCDQVVPVVSYAQEVSVSAMLNAYIDNAGQLRAATIRTIESGLAGDGLIGSSSFRMLTPYIEQGDIIPNYVARDTTTGETAQTNSFQRYPANTATFSTANLNILTVLSVPSGTYIQAGQEIYTAGFPSGTFITRQINGVSGGAGTYAINWAGNYLGASAVLLLKPSLNATMQSGITPYDKSYLPLSTTPYLYPFFIDGSRPANLGGFQVDLSGLVVFIQPKTY